MSDIPVTLKEAKKHWKHTKTLLKKEARAAFKRGEHWRIEPPGFPVVISDGVMYAIGFAKNEHHKLFSFDVSCYDPGWLPRGVKEWRPR
jgi:glycosidase